MNAIVNNSFNTDIHLINLAFFAMLANSKNVIWKSVIIMLYGSIKLEIYVKAEDFDKN